MLQSNGQKLNESTDSKAMRVDVTQKPQPVSRQPSMEPTEAVECFSSPEQKALHEKKLKWIQEVNVNDGSTGWDCVELDGNIFELHSSYEDKARTRIVANTDDKWKSYRGLGVQPRGDGYPCNENGFWQLKRYEKTTPYKATVYTITSLKDSPGKITLAGLDNKNQVYLKEDGFQDDSDLWCIYKGKEHGTYHICWYKNTLRTLTQWGCRSDEWGAVLSVDSASGDWRLTPRFDVKLDWYLVFHYDNRTGTKDIVREEQVEVGITLTESNTIDVKTELKNSMKLAAHAGIALEGVGDFGESMEVENSIDDTVDSSMTSDVEKSWSRMVNTKFIVPAGKNYRVKGIKTTFNGLQNLGDSMGVTTAAKHYRIDETPGDLPDIHTNCPARKIIEDVDFTCIDE